VTGDLAPRRRSPARSTTQEINMRRDAEKETFWRTTIQEAEASGLSIKAFCQDRGLKDNLFYAWRRTLKQRNESPSGDPGFVELIDSEAGPHGSGVEIRVGDQVSIRIWHGFDEQTLKTALAALGVVSAS
jgi:transposase